MTDWNKVRIDAAIAALPKCIDTCETVLLRGGKLPEGSLSKQAAFTACDYADALVSKLKEGEI